MQKFSKNTFWNCHIIRSSKICITPLSYLFFCKPVQGHCVLYVQLIVKSPFGSLSSIWEFKAEGQYSKVTSAKQIPTIQLLFLTTLQN